MKFGLHRLRGSNLSNFKKKIKAHMSESSANLFLLACSDSDAPVAQPRDPSASLLSFSHTRSQGPWWAVSRLAAAPSPAALVACAAEPLPAGRQKPPVAFGHRPVAGRGLAGAARPVGHRRGGDQGSGADLHLLASPDSGPTANPDACSPPHRTNSGEW